MCGIFGYVGTQPAEPLILEAPCRVGYRGYDSAGAASLDSNGKIELRRVVGDADQLAPLLASNPLTGTIGIGHVRWATHGEVNEQNAHPHVAGHVALVHNGIIENFADLRRDLEEKGCVFHSTTDTEVIAHLINRFLETDVKATPLDAVKQAIDLLKGSFALVVMFANEPRYLIAVRKGSPLVIGHGATGWSVGSDPLAISHVASTVTRLGDGAMAIVGRERCIMHDRAKPSGIFVMQPIPKLSSPTDKGAFQHYMLKEIHEQPEVIEKTWKGLSSFELPFDPNHINQLLIIGCGTAYHAGLVAQNWIESQAGIPVNCEVASEFLYRNSPNLYLPGRVGLFISQSGETADSMAVLDIMKTQHKIPTFAIVNTPANSMADLADSAAYTVAWPEVAVASTKAFTAQLVVLARFAIELGRQRGNSDQWSQDIFHAFSELPSLVQQVLDLEPELAEIGRYLAETARGVLYIGRGTNYAIAREGALKLKEVSYMFAEAYPAGELKHGPLALIEPDVPAVVIAPPDRWFGKTLSNLHEIDARRGRVILLSDDEGCRSIKRKLVTSVALPKTHTMADPIIYAVAVQLLAYHTALAKGAPIDKPRNLAKASTTE